MVQLLSHQPFLLPCQVTNPLAQVTLHWEFPPEEVPVDGIDISFDVNKGFTIDWPRDSLAGPLLLGQPGQLETNLYQVHADLHQLRVGLGPGWAGQGRIWGEMPPLATSDLGSVDYGTLNNQPAFNNTPCSQLSCSSQPANQLLSDHQPFCPSILILSHATPFYSSIFPQINHSIHPSSICSISYPSSIHSTNPTVHPL